MKPFIFYSCLSEAKFAGIKASSVPEFYEGVKKSSSGVIFYHLFYSLYKRHVEQVDYINDFAGWLWKAVGEQALAEQIAVFDPLKIKNLKWAKDEILKVIRNYSGPVKPGKKVRPGDEFYFMDIISFIAPSSIVVEDEREFFDKFKDVSLKSVFYHLIEARLRLNRLTNDFSEWLGSSCGRDDLAGKINELNPHHYTLGEIKRKIREIGLNV